MDEAEHAHMVLWFARVAWAVLPITAGTAFADALDDWSHTPALVATALLWGAWAIGLLALLAPRPWGCTALRVVAPCTTLLAIACIPSTGLVSAVIAVTTTIAAAALALSAPVTASAVNALAYGDEERFALHIPTPLLLGPVPLAIVFTGAGASTGLLLLADGRIVIGIVTAIIGIPLTFALVRALHALSRRMLVLVPAGIAVVDPLTLVDPVLVRREHIAALRRASTTSLPEDALDLRLGTLAGSVVVDLEDPVQFGRRRGRADAEVMEPSALALAVVHASTLLQHASARRIVTR